MKKSLFFRNTAIVILSCFVNLVSAATWYLSPTGSDTNDGSSGTPFKTLSKAFSASSNNDVIHVTGFIDITAEPSKAGSRTDIALAGTSTYTTGGVTYNTWNVNSTLGIIALSKALTIIGDDKATCGFDGKNVTCIIRQDGTTNTNLVTYQNLTFKNGKSADGSGGGGMYIRSTSATFTNCEFTSNASGGSGNVNPGGAVTIISATATFNTTRFASNIAKFGCGIYAQSGTITLDGCTIENNDASGVASSVGAGIYASIISGALNLNVKNTNFKSNKVASNGGALYYTDAAAFASTLKFTNCAFISNTVGGSGLGGAAYIDNKTASATLNLSFINNTFYDNLVGGTSGGAMLINSALTGSNISLINCTLTGNKVTGTTGSAGAAIRMLSATLNSIRRIYNCIIENNVGTTEDMSLINNYTDFVVQSDSYTAGTTLIIDKSFIAKSTNTNFGTQFGSANTVNYAAVTSGSINNSFRAQFGTFNSTGNYFPLQSTSTAIGYGTTSYLTSLIPTVTTDQLGYTRPSPCNAGAVEIKTAAVNADANLSTYSPTSATDVTVTAGVLTVDGNASVKSITVAPGAKLTHSSGTLTATNGITLQSDATGTATILNSGTYTGTITAEQYLGSARNWYVSSPVSAATSPAANITRYYEYVEAGNNADFSVAGSTAYWKGLSTGHSMAIGKGYIAQASAGTTVQFSGTPNNGNITTSFNLTRDDAKGKGFNLVGNPYPSYIDWSLVAQANSNLMSTAWFKTKKTDVAGAGYTFASVNVTTPSSPEIVANNANTTITKYIPPTQAFWVRVKSGTSSTSMSFTNAMREHRLDNGDLMKAPKVNERSRLRLQLVNGIESDETLIYFDKIATNDFNEYDSPKMMNNSAVTPDLYTKAGIERLVINGMNAIVDNMELPLGFSLNAPASLKLKATEMSNFPVGTRIYLLDKVESSQVELLPETEYTFKTKTSTTNNESRFNLLFRAPGGSTGISNTEKGITQFFVNAANQITIIAPVKSNYAIYNAVGQLIENGILNYKLHTLNCKLNAGVYVVKVNNQSTRVIVK